MTTSNIDDAQSNPATTGISGERPSRKPWRLWPGVVAVVLEWLLWFGIPRVAPDLMLYALIAGAISGLAVLLWWLFFSRAPWSERLGVILLMVVGMMATSRIVDRSIANAGMGMMLPIFSIPVLTLALVSWAVAAHGLSSLPRRISLAAAVLLGCGVFAVVRTGGISGEGNSDLHWRWSKTPEQLLLAQPEEATEPLEQPALLASAPAPAAAQAADSGSLPPDTQPTPGSTPAAGTSPDKTSGPATTLARAVWPGFRGASRDDVIRGLQIETDWAKSPPVELWRRKIGPGWSSFAVRGDLCYTQEQRGDEELVSCYNVTTGSPVWRHGDAARFWESNAGPGPRATPTLSGARVYSFGATGILNALDAASGAVVWSRNAASDTSIKLPGWGFASSPLVVRDTVIVATSGRLAAYDAATGKPRWLGPEHNGGYSSPQLMTIGGVPQVLILSNTGLTSVAPTDGTVLWEHAWQGTPILQPARAPDDGVLITTSDNAGGIGTRRLAVTHGSGGWTAEERWTSTGLKPYFNDFVVHKGHVYGFDSSILACIDLADGQRKWKGGRYGHGQLILLPDQDLLLVLSEEGELALVKAVPDQFKEIAQVPAIQGKTWNHPVIVGDLLLVRNGEEMAAFKLPLAAH